MESMTFEFEGNPILSFVDDRGRDWFRATEICRVLDFKNSYEAVQSHADGYQKEWKLGKGRPAVYVSEPGLYALIFASKSPAAKPFQRWVFEEVLPSLRSTGQYGSQLEQRDRVIEEMDRLKIYHQLKRVCLDSLG